MDIVNTLENIIQKIRQQMFQKKIYSLDVLYELIEEEGKYYSIKEIDIFFAKIGVYLKSQEITELLNYCRYNESQIDLVKFVYLFRTAVPTDIVDELKYNSQNIYEKPMRHRNHQGPGAAHVIYIRFTILISFLLSGTGGRRHRRHGQGELPQERAEEPQAGVRERMQVRMCSVRRKRPVLRSSLPFRG